MTEEQLRAYRKDGYIFFPSYFSEREVERLKSQLPTALAEDGPGRIVEDGGGLLRSVYGSHFNNETFRNLARHPRLVGPVRQALGSEIYLYQFKINVKAAFGGDVWQWHQDYIFWRNEDGMGDQQVMNAAVFLDEVNEFNAPLTLIPGSHREGVIEVLAKRPDAGRPAWVSNLSARLKYSLDKETVARLVAGYGLVAPKGPAGSALFFHCNLVHSSSNNISPFDRVIAFVTFNSVSNIPVPANNPRPEFLAGRDYSPVAPVSDDVFLM